MMSSKSSSTQALPPLSSLMRACVHPRSGRMEGVGEADFEYNTFREGPPNIIELSRLESPQSGYQHSHLVIPGHTPMTSGHLPHAEANYHNVPDMENFRFAMISPVSPRTRCPSLTDSILSSTGCTSPGSHSPTTPISERGSTSAYGDERGNITGPSYRDVQRNNHRYQQSHYHKHRVSKSYQPSTRLHGSVSPPPPPIARLAISGTENTKEKMTKHEKRRINHLNSEKKRRENIKDGMKALFKLVPECRDKGMSKANILKKTREFILELHDGAKNIQMELRHVRQENDDLRMYLNQQQKPCKFTCRL